MVPASRAGRCGILFLCFKVSQHHLETWLQMVIAFMKTSTMLICKILACVEHLQSWAKRAKVWGPQRPLCFTLYVKLCLYSPLGDSKPLGAIVKSITLWPARVLSERANGKKIEEKEKRYKGEKAGDSCYLPFLLA